jgi:hypothetical protein
VTAVGKVEVARTYRSCPDCGAGGFPADAVLGIDGGFTRRARRSICHVGIDNSFDRGERTLRELAGWSVDAETIRRICHAEAKACRQSKAERLNVATSFAEAEGGRELQIGAGKVNTETG